MAWFLRKAFTFGPLRINLSKRGLGASFGVKGARVGIDAKGRPYAAGGRGGLYFRRYAKRPRPDEPAAPGPDVAPGSRPTSPLAWIMLGVILAVFALAVVMVVAR